MKKFIDEFKAFAMQGNVLDMAIGVVIGTAFGSIVTSLVNDILMPLVSVITGGHSFESLVIVLNQSTELTLNYGKFLQSVIDFGIIAFSIFVFVKMINSLSKKPEPVEEAPAVVEDTADQKLLKEILEELRKK